MQRHFKVQTVAGIEDIRCNDIDESNADEVWFIFTDLPPRIFRRDAILSLQETPVPTPEQQRAEQARWEKIASEWDIPETYEPD